MSGCEAWRFHREGSEVSGPCRRRWCFQCWRYRLVDWAYRM